MRNNFEHNLIKGRIAETIFEGMFRDTKKFTVLHSGYEYTESVLAQYRSMVVMKKVLDTISKTPDFVLITEDKQQVYLVEVKYRAEIDKKDLIDIATTISKNWNPSYIFLVSKSGFYFDSVNKIKESGDIKELSKSWVVQEIQNKYKKLAEDWLWSHKD
ncbi:MAG: hypothetical protein HYT13_02965 [Candidatus Liptonbacteria bacterium]|nr:hypothetical protein [Candidatus Liptonbacteria bacterium]